jgi:hypothetical protein
LAQREQAHDLSIWINGRRFISGKLFKKIFGLKIKSNTEFQGKMNIEFFEKWFQEQSLSNLALKPFGCAAKTFRSALQRLVQNCCSSRAYTQRYELDDTARIHGYRAVPLPLV